MKQSDCVALLIYIYLYVYIYIYIYIYIYVDFFALVTTYLILSLTSLGRPCRIKS